jgi:hypothetical protein
MGATTDFTMEAWVYQINQTGNHTIFSQYNGSGTSHSAANGHRWIFWIDDGAVQLYQYPDMTTQLLDSGTLNLNTWNHVAVTREGSVFRLFVNGTQVDTFTSSTIEIGFLNDPLTVGSYNATGYFNGRISDVRVVKGTAVYTSAFTPPTERLTAITNTSLLACHLPYIADGSTNNHSITVNGNTKTEPFSPYGHSGYTSGSNSGSMYFDGSGDYLSIADATSVRLGSGEFTVEFWIYMTSLARVVFVDKYDGTSAGWQIQYRDYNNVNHIAFSTNAGHYATTPSDEIELNTWYHVAAVRDSSDTLKIYINGVEKGSSSNYTQDLTSTTGLNIGVQTYNVAAGYMNGHISDARIVKGTAVYTSAFTPPTAPLTAITNTSLLINGTDAGIIDKSQSVKTITLDGNVKSSTAQTKYLSSSMYFDGTGDYVRIDGNETLSSYAGDFTIEMWVYPTGAGPVSGAYLYHQAASATSYSPILIVQSAGSYNFTAYASSTLSGWDLASAVSIGSGTQNSWHHIAVVREGTNLKTFLNGTLGTTTSVGTTSLGSATTTYTRLGGGNYANTDFTGYMSDVRITKGLARYTSNFTPPSAALQG